MKNKVLILGMMLIFLRMSAQIPNPGFENWIQKGPYDEPEGWFSYNMFYDQTGVVVCEKSLQHTEGQYAIKLISRYSTPAGGVFPGWVMTGSGTGEEDILLGFPCNQRPRYFKCDMQYNRMGQDLGVICVRFTKWDTSANKRVIIGEKIYELFSSVTDWKLLQLRITYLYSDNPDTCSIFLVCSDEETAVDGTYLIVDNMRFEDTPTGTEDPLLSLQFDLYPNPVSDELSISLNTNESGSALVQLYDMQGKLVQEQTEFILQGDNLLKIRLVDRQEGIYLLVMNLNNHRSVHQIIKSAN